jgi:hypothetical protein
MRVHFNAVRRIRQRRIRKAMKADSSSGLEMRLAINATTNVPATQDSLAAEVDLLAIDRCISRNQE